MMQPDTTSSLSIIVPVYSGASYLNELVSHIEGVRSDWRGRGAPMEIAELILVDDAAVDRSSEIIDELAKAHGWITAIHLMRNFGQHAATIAGILHSSGDWVVTMDEDLQHPPAEIEALLAHAVRGGFDIVYGRPIGTVHEAPSRDLPSRAFKKMMVFLAGDPNIVHFNSFRLLRGSLARATSSVCGHETYFDVALSWFTKRVGICNLELKDRRYISDRSSGYGLRRLLSHARRLLFSSNVKLIRAFGVVGIMVVALSAFGSFALLLSRILYPESYSVSGWTSLMLATVFFGGLVTLMVAIVIEYVSILVQASHGRPLFFTVDRSVDAPLVAYFGSASR